MFDKNRTVPPDLEERLEHLRREFQTVSKNLQQAEDQRIMWQSRYNELDSQARAMSMDNEKLNLIASEANQEAEQWRNKFLRISQEYEDYKRNIDRNFEGHVKI